LAAEGKIEKRIAVPVSKVWPHNELEIGIFPYLFKIQGVVELWTSTLLGVSSGHVWIIGTAFAKNRAHHSLPNDFQDTSISLTVNLSTSYH
jgi:hypothetical protein